ncbi:hypothetical protein RN001_001517 [Aquatica leii]|uniref:Retrotransposon gag domain-containing protein n=1 Tax=Aquatica leii TaxID=1421715 RepID=A0AAN7PNN4_9COLE|nr:hypothetical protein RN001_001517 [Aquatica leii]
MNPSSSNSISIENPQPSTSYSLSLKFQCKLISTEFSGNRYDLGQFLANCNSANQLATENQKVLLLFYILSKITERERERLGQQTFQSWDSLKNKLKELYQDKKHYCQLVEELNNCKQRPNEDISKYFQIIELLNSRALSAVQQYTSDPKLLDGKIHTINEITLNRFIYHSHPAISQMFRWKEFLNLNSALTVALTEEKSLNIHKTFQKRPYCTVIKNNLDATGNQWKNNHDTNICKMNAMNHYKILTFITPKMKAEMSCETSFSAGLEFRWNYTPIKAAILSLGYFKKFADFKVTHYASTYSIFRCNFKHLELVKYEFNLKNYNENCNLRFVRPQVDVCSECERLGARLKDDNLNDRTHAS